MKDLLELAQIVTRTKLRNVELLGTSSQPDGEVSKIQQFYDMLQDGIVNDDDSAAHELYGEDKNASKYQKLRGTVKERLINALFIIDLKSASYSDRQTAYYECYRQWAAAKILLGKQARTTAITICRKLQKIARKFEFTELLVDILHTMRLYHGTIEGDFKKYSQYNTDFKHQQDVWIEENRAEELYIDLSIGYVNTKSTKLEIKEKAVQYYNQIKEALNTHDSYQLHLCGRLIEASQYTSVNDYKNTLTVCDDAISFFASKAYKANVPLQIFYYQKLICHLQLRQFSDALEAAKECDVFLENGTFNWFKLQETYFLLYIHQQQYQNAYEILKKVRTHTGFENLPENVRETWLISAGYIYFLQKTGNICEDETSRSFRLSRFLNEMEVFSKDKKGMNITIIILELLIQLAEGNFDYLIDRREAVDKYRKRYIKGDELKRSHLFMKMMLQLPRNAFDIATIEEKVSKDYAELEGTPIELANQAFEIEVVPYEHLWKIVMKLI